MTKTGHPIRLPGMRRVATQPLGKCPQCGAWDAMIEEVVAEPQEGKAGSLRGITAASTPVKLSEIEGDITERFPLRMQEFARVLGGGVVPGSIVLVGGDPGIGKSTLLLQMALEMATKGAVCLRRGIRAPDQNARRAPAGGRGTEERR